MSGPIDQIIAVDETWSNICSDVYDLLRAGFAAEGFSVPLIFDVHRSAAATDGPVCFEKVLYSRGTHASVRSAREHERLREALREMCALPPVHLHADRRSRAESSGGGDRPDRGLATPTVLFFERRRTRLLTNAEALCAAVLELGFRALLFVENVHLCRYPTISSQESNGQECHGDI